VEIIATILVLLFIIFSLVMFAVIQIQMAGIEVKDFWSFINANQELDKLYAFAKKYEKMSPQEQIIFLKAAEKMSDAFEKVPTIIWEDEYQKYRDVMDIYRDIKVKRWEANSK
jgi:biopolymer transport protein ExbB/TolQ